jgi:hypothetical protein
LKSWGQIVMTQVSRATAAHAALFKNARCSPANAVAQSVCVVQGVLHRISPENSLLHNSM